MKVIMKRSVGIVLSLVLCICMVFVINLSVNATTVDYVKNGSYIYNWGTREEVANFLSPNAEAFYTKNNTTYAKLAALNGSHIESSVPSSALYKELQNLMQKNHSYVTTYNATRDKFQYTDCQNSGKTSKKISSFYSGKEIGPSWDSGNTWNREHCWPNSKGDAAGKGEDDIMMLRPASVSENSSRGNKAYGNGSGYYNPNNESGGKYDLRGDVARIVLYQYVRWNCTNTGSYNSKGIYGTGGVIESRAVLLDWMKADPVDTWELGRNDSVQSITGTRNVFVDYPELAFIMLGTDVPTDYTTPSGEAKKGTTTPGGTTSTPSGTTSTPSGTTSTPSTNNNSSTTSKPNTNTNSSQTTTSKPTGNTSSTTTSTPTNTSCSHKNTQNVEAVDARCDAEGFTAGKYCSDCKSYISGHKIVEATGHTYAGDCDACCDTCGAERATPTDHVYDDTDVCTLCGASKENAENNNDSDQTIGAITEDDNNPTDTEEESEGIGTVWWIVIIVAAVAAAAGTTFVIVYFIKSKKQ